MRIFPTFSTRGKRPQLARRCRQVGCVSCCSTHCHPLCNSSSTFSSIVETNIYRTRDCWTSCDDKWPVSSSPATRLLGSAVFRRPRCPSQLQPYPRLLNPLHVHFTPKAVAIVGSIAVSRMRCLPPRRTRLLLPRGPDPKPRPQPIRKLLVPQRHQKVGTRHKSPQNVRAIALQMVSHAMLPPAVSSIVPSRQMKLATEPLRGKLAQGEYACSISRVDRADLAMSVDIAMGRSRLQRHHPRTAIPLRQHQVGRGTGLSLGRAKAKAVRPPALPPPRLRDSAADPRLLHLGP